MSYPAAMVVAEAAGCDPLVHGHRARHREGYDRYPVHDRVADAQVTYRFGSMLNEGGDKF